MTAPIRPRKPAPRDSLADAWDATPAPGAHEARETRDPLAEAWDATTGPSSHRESFSDKIVGTVRAFLGQGVGAGFGDELEAAAYAAMPGPTGPTISPVRYVGERDRIRAAQQQFSAAHQTIAPAAEVVGSLAGALLLPAGAAARGVSAGARVADAMRTGAAFGALSGLGKGEGGAGAQGLSALEGAGAGALFGGAVQGAGETARKIAQAASASPRALDAAAKVAPTARVRAFLERRAQAARDATVNRNVLERLAQDEVTPAAARQFVQDAPETIPVALADVGEENTRQGFAALKRLKGKQKNQITQTVDARDQAAPTWLRRSIREHTANDAAALGLDPAAIDVRSANPNTVAAEARAALGARSDTRYAPAMERPGLQEPDALARFSALLSRPSMRRALRTGEALAAESGERVPLRALAEAPGASDVVAAAPAARSAASAGPRAGTKLARAIDEAHAGGDVAPPSSAAQQERFYRALNDDALGRQWMRETERVMREDERVGQGQWARQRDDGSVVSGGSTTSGQGTVQGRNARARLARVEAELRARGFSDEHINGLFFDQPLPARADNPVPGSVAAPEAAPTAGPRASGGASRSVPAPTVRQLHYIKMGLDEQIGALEARQALLERSGPKGGAKGGTTNTKLAKLRRTKRELLGVIDAVAPEYAAAMQAHAAEAAPISAFQQGRRLPTSALPEDVETRLAELPNPNARTAYGAGYARRLQADAAARRANPVRAVVGSGAPDDPRVQNLRALLPAAAPGIERDAALVARIKRTNAAVKGNSMTAERVGEDAARARGLIRKVLAAANLARGKLSAVGDVFQGTYGPEAEATARRLALGAAPGERAALVRYLMELEQSEAAKRLTTGTRRRPLGALAGYGAGSAAAAVNR